MTGGEKNQVTLTLESISKGNLEGIATILSNKMANM